MKYAVTYTMDDNYHWSYQSTLDEARKEALHRASLKECSDIFIWKPFEGIEYVVCPAIVEVEVEY